MELDELKTYLNSDDSQQRLKAITELRKYDSDVAIPLLLTKLDDREFLVRSFVAMGLGRKQSPDSFAALLNLMKYDKDGNVRAEASNSLSLYGEVAVKDLVETFKNDDNWLVRRSILAALVEMNYPSEVFEICVCGVKGADLTVQESCVDSLPLLVNTPKQEEALQLLLSLVDDDWWRLRMKVARALGKFKDPRSTEALNKLRLDEDHRVTGAVLESLLP